MTFEKANLSKKHIEMMLEVEQHPPHPPGTPPWKGWELFEVWRDG